MIRTVLSALALLAALISAPADAATTVRCESDNGRYRVCPIDTRGGVRLAVQLSSNGCWLNDTWGYDRNRIWVDRGCRADFRVGSDHSSSGKDNAVAAAVVLGLVGAAIIADQHNDRDRDRDRYDDDYGNPRRTFSCESKDDRFTYCALPFRGHVEVYKQRSSSPCV